MPRNSRRPSGPTSKARIIARGPTFWARVLGPENIARDPSGLTYWLDTRSGLHPLFPAELNLAFFESPFAPQGLEEHSVPEADPLGGYFASLVPLLPDRGEG